MKITVNASQLASICVLIGLGGLLSACAPLPGMNPAAAVPEAAPMPVPQPATRPTAPVAIASPLPVQQQPAVVARRPSVVRHPVPVPSTPARRAPSAAVAQRTPQRSPIAVPPELNPAIEAVAANRVVPAARPPAPTQAQSQTQPQPPVQQRRVIPAPSRPVMAAPPPRITYQTNEVRRPSASVEKTRSVSVPSVASRRVQPATPNTGSTSSAAAQVQSSRTPSASVAQTTTRSGATTSGASSSTNATAAQASPMTAATRGTIVAREVSIKPPTAAVPEKPAAPPPPPMPASETMSQSPAVTVLIKQANNELVAGKSSRAVATLERALRIAPDDAMLWLRLAEANEQQGNKEQARSMAKKAVSLSPDSDSVKQRAQRLIN